MCGPWSRSPRTQVLPVSCVLHDRKKHSTCLGFEHFQNMRTRPSDFKWKLSECLLRKRSSEEVTRSDTDAGVFNTQRLVSSNGLCNHRIWSAGEFDVGGPRRHFLSREDFWAGARPDPDHCSGACWQLAVAAWCVSPIFWASQGTKGPTVPRGPVTHAPSKLWAWVQPVSSSGHLFKMCAAPRWSTCPLGWLMSPEKTVCLGKRGLRAGQSLGSRHCARLGGQRDL